MVDCDVGERWLKDNMRMEEIAQAPADVKVFSTSLALLDDILCNFHSFRTKLYFVLGTP